MQLASSPAGHWARSVRGSCLHARCTAPLRIVPQLQPGGPGRQTWCRAASRDQPGEGQDEDALRQAAEQMRVEEEAARHRREQIELQLMRMSRETALRQYRASLPGAQPASPSSPSAPVSAGSGAAGPPGRRKVLKKSKRMAAMAAGAGLLRVTPGTASPAFPAGADDREGSPGPQDDEDGVPSTTALGGLAIQPGRAASPGLAAAIAGAACPPGAAGGPAATDSGDGMCIPAKPIFIVSDCTGESAARTVRAALNQFELCYKTSAPASLIVFRFVEDEKKAYKIVETAAREDALVVYTLVRPAVLKAVQTACKLMNVRSVDLWSNLLDCMETHLDTLRSGVPIVDAMRRPVGEDYFAMIECVEYTRKMDDGANPKEWKKADLLILGVSRCGKTPLSIYLGQRGYKVANLPLVAGAPLPKELFEIDQSRIVGLTIDPTVLMSIRRNRVTSMGVGKDVGMSINYAELSKINEELAFARQLYAANPDWPVLDVTLRGVEETAARILKLLNDKRGDASPQWVEEMYGKMAASSETPAAVPVKPMYVSRGEQHVLGGYSGGEQYLVEGLY